MTAKQSTPITDFVKKAYFGYFGMKLGDQDKIWAPLTVCRSCVENLRQWTNGIRNVLVFQWYGESLKIILTIATFVYLCMF